MRPREEADRSVCPKLLHSREPNDDDALQRINSFKLHTFQLSISFSGDASAKLIIGSLVPRAGNSGNSGPNDVHFNVKFWKVRKLRGNTLELHMERPGCPLSAPTPFPLWKLACLELVSSWAHQPCSRYANSEINPQGVKGEVIRKQHYTSSTRCQENSIET